MLPDEDEWKGADYELNLHLNGTWGVVRTISHFSAEGQGIAPISAASFSPQIHSMRGWVVKPDVTMEHGRKEEGEEKAMRRKRPYLAESEGDSEQRSKIELCEGW